MKVGVVGLGYVGLPLAVAYAEEGHEVVGLDADPRKVDALAERRSYVEDVPSESLAALDGGLVATSRYADLSSCEAVIICVPTPLTNSREPDLSYMVDAATSLAAVMQKGQLIVLESTTYPRSTCPTRRASTTSTPSSSSWPGRSTRTSRSGACGGSSGP
jgi:UDP-N-acetyl-D-glucosamine dehydrogenase